MADGKGLGGAGRLTIARIDTIQSFYGLCIRQNKGDAKAMSKATRAILLHYSSTGENPQHDCCPVGPSWCSYQRDLACKTKSHRYIKDPLPPAVVDVIKPVFDKLGDESFLVDVKDVQPKMPMKVCTMSFGDLHQKTSLPHKSKIA